MDSPQALYVGGCLLATGSNTTTNEISDLFVPAPYFRKAMLTFCVIEIGGYPGMSLSHGRIFSLIKCVSSQGHTGVLERRVGCQSMSPFPSSIALEGRAVLS
jgi:hypothetical protein